MKPNHKSYDNEDDLINEICMRKNCPDCLGEAECLEIPDLLKKYGHLVKGEETKLYGWLCKQCDGETCLSFSHETLAECADDVSGARREKIEEVEIRYKKIGGKP